MGSAAAPLARNIWGGPIAVRATGTNPLRSDVSTADTIAILRKLVRQYQSHPWVVASTQEALVEHWPAASHRDMACAIFHWVRRKVRFVEDEQLMYEQLGVPYQHLDKELLIVPPTLLAMPQPMGDCDDFSLLLACQLACAGLEPFFVTVAADPHDPRKFSHIYVCARLADESSYLALDAGNRLAAVEPGWELPRVTRKAIWAI